MSFILDALRKSDTERQQQATPGLSTAQQRVKKTRQTIWVPLLTGVLILNAGVVAWIFLTDTEDAAVTPTASEPSSEPTPQADARSLRREAEASSAATPAPQPVEQPAADSQPEVTKPAAAAVPSAPPAQDPAPVATVEEAPETDVIQNSLPSLEQLLVGGVISTDPLHLDIHVYAEPPAKRFVFINMSKYKEGERTKEGPLIEEITSYGVILSHQGQRFTLERN